MKSKHYQIYFTDEAPFTNNGKAKTAIWKKADTIKDFFNLETLEKSKADNSVKMLFDDNFLYLSFKSVIANALHYFSETRPHWDNTYFWIDLTNEKDENIWFFFMESGKYQFYFEGKEIQDPDFKIFTTRKETKKAFECEFNIIFPWKYLTNNIQTYPAVNIKIAEHRKFGDTAELDMTSLVNPCIIDGKNIYLSGELNRKTNQSGSVRSARDVFFKSNSNINLTLTPKKNGTVYKNILGMNNSPRIAQEAAMEKEKELFKKLAPARVRHHDAALNDPGFALIDVSRIFPLFCADHNNPAHYDFGPTDLCLEQVADCGFDIEFHFGESIEHSARRFRVIPPNDTEKWAEICVNILRHYNEGWANGKKLNIKYVSLWEEPDGQKLFDGPYEDYLKLYKSFATKIKKAFPEVKVGGPQSMQNKAVEQLAAYCKENALPLDFLSRTGYTREPALFANAMLDVRKIADNYGFKKSEIFLSEWNMAPRNWLNIYADRAMPNTMLNASFCTATMITLQNIVDMAYFYLWANAGYWGLLSNWQEPFKVYYAFLLYTEFVRKKLKQIPSIASSRDSGIYHLAGISNDNKVYMLVSQFRSPAEQLTIELPADYKKCIVKILSDAHPTGEGIVKLKSKGKGKFSFPLDAKVFGVYLMEFDK